jgi:hypothetical protein
MRDSTVVPISPLNVLWRVEDDERVLEIEESEPDLVSWGPSCRGRGSGEAVLVADVPFLGRSARFDVTVEGP